MKKRYLYWLAQIIGWISFSAIIAISNILSGEDITDLHSILILTGIVFIGVLMSHIIRSIYKKFKLFNLEIYKALPIAILSSVILGTISSGFFVLLNSIIGDPNNQSKFENFISTAISMSLVYFIWLILYISYHYFQNIQQQKIKSLELKSSQKEIQLNNLKNQLNPHFIFNAMNSIRALINEDPNKAKDAVTQLSGLLRNSLQTNTKQLISIREELNFVKDYLELEKIRYEERLKFNISIDNDINNHLFPPLMLQTLVENAIKHGISKYTAGGILEISIKTKDQNIIATVTNTGQLDNGDKNATVGIKNTKNRLELLFDEKATFSLINIDPQNVKAQVIIPKILVYENINS